MNGSWTSPVLNVAVLIQIAGVTLAFGHSPIGIAAIPLGVALLILGGVVYRRELKRRRSIAEQMLVSQVVFLLFVLVTIRTAWRGLSKYPRTEEPHAV